MYFLTLSFKKNDPKFEKTWDHRIPVWNGSKTKHCANPINTYESRVRRHVASHPDGLYNYEQALEKCLNRISKKSKDMQT